MKNNAIRIATGLNVILAVAAMTGCASPAKTARVAPMPEPPQETVKPKEVEVPLPVLVGKVLETMSVGSYTYLLVEKDGRSTWSAVPISDVKVGEEVTVYQGIDMVNFKSTSLGRSFPYIHFSGGLKDARPYVAPEKKEHAVKAAMPSSHPDIAAAAPADAEAKPAYQPVLSGTVVEKMDANGYSYVCLEKDGKKTWAAIPVTKVKTGTDLSIYPGAIMPSFTSKSLNRTFENIVFSRGAIKADKE